MKVFVGQGDNVDVLWRKTDAGTLPYQSILFPRERGIDQESFPFSLDHIRHARAAQLKDILF